MDATLALKLASSGNSLEFSTYLGGSNVNQGNAIALDSSANAHITGSTSTDANAVILTKPDISLAVDHDWYLRQ